MTPAQKRAYVIADNKLALNAGWDEELLGQGTEGRCSPMTRFRHPLTGFSIPKIDGLIEGLEARGARRSRMTTGFPLGDGRAHAGQATSGRLGHTG